ncbi:MAG: DUF4160 domain-containing protein [Thermomicrobiales bacterium]
MDATIAVKVAERGRHHLPHCHVRWSDGSSSVALPGLTVIEGDALPRMARSLLDEHNDELADMWNLLNPGRPIE